MPTTYNDPIMLDSTGQDIVDKLDSIASLMGDGVIDDTSTTATDKTWSASKENTTVNGLKSNINANTKLIKDTVGWSGKNKLDIKLSYIKASYPTLFVGNTLNIYGVSFIFETDSNDNVTKITGGGSNATQVVNLVLIPRLLPEGLILATGSYKANGTPTMPSGCFVRYFCTRGGEAVVLGDDTGNGIECNIQSTDVVGCLISVANGKSINGLEFNLMLRDASILDDTYEPYHKDVVDTLREAEVIKGKNLLENQSNYRTVNGLTFTGDSDGVVNVNGTPSADTYFRVNTKFNKAGKYVLNGIVNGGTNFRMQAYIYNSSDTFQRSYTDTGSGVDVTIDDGEYANVEIIVTQAGGAVSNKKVYPMLRLATETDPTFEPYYIPLKDSMLPRSEQAIVGADNLMSSTIYELNTASAEVGDSTFTTYAGVQSFIAPIKRNTTYTLSRANGNRFRVALSTSFPANGVACKVLINADINEYTFNSGNYDYVFVMMNAGSETYDNIKPVLNVGEVARPFVPYAMTNEQLTNKMFPRSEQAVLGAKNLLTPNLSGYIPGGLTVTNDNGVLTINGTLASQDNIILKPRVSDGVNYQYLPKGSYTFDCKGSSGSYRVFVGTTYNGSYAEWGAGSSVTFTIDDNTNSDYKLSDGSVLVGFWATIPANTYNNEKLYPLLTVAGDTDRTFAPYAMTNKELTEHCVISVTDIKTDFKTLLMGTSGSNVTDVETATVTRYGKLMIFNSRINKATNTALGSVNVSIPYTLIPKIIGTVYVSLHSPKGAGTASFGGGYMALRYTNSDEATYIDMTFIAIVDE